MTAAKLLSVAQRGAKYLQFSPAEIARIRVSTKQPPPLWAVVGCQAYGVTDIDDHPRLKDCKLRIWINVKLCEQDGIPAESTVLHEVTHIRNWLKIFPSMDERLAEDCERILYRLYLEGEF